MLADEVLIHAGLSIGELVAASGLFKLREIVCRDSDQSGNGENGAQ
jgi:hypothetical protein